MRVYTVIVLTDGVIKDLDTDVETFGYKDDADQEYYRLIKSHAKNVEIFQCESSLQTKLNPICLMIYKLHDEQMEAYIQTSLPADTVQLELSTFKQENPHNKIGGYLLHDFIAWLREHGDLDARLIEKPKLDGQFWF